MTVAFCVCCSKAGVAVVGKEQNILKWWTNLSLLKLNKTKLMTVCICHKCYLRLKLCHAYRETFLGMHRIPPYPPTFRNANPVPTLMQVSVISNCPVCFTSEPSTQHIYEHIANSQCNGCGEHVENLDEHIAASPGCTTPNEGQRKTAPVYYCNSACGASFERIKLLEIHQNVCAFVQRQMKVEPIDSESATTYDSEPVTPTCLVEQVDVSIPLKTACSTDKAKTILNGPSTHKRTVSKSRKKIVSPKKSASSIRKAYKTVYVNSTGAQRTYYKEQCWICNEWVVKLNRHLMSHDPYRHYECTMCHKVLKNEITRKDHEANFCPLRQVDSSGNDENLYVCEVCGTSYALKRYLIRHRKTHITYPCSVCNETVSKASESFHMKSVHSNKAVICDFCGKLMKSRYALSSHIFLHHRTDVKLHECDKCGKKYKLKHQMTVHRRTHEVGEKEHLCKTCGLTFFSQASLRSHFNNVHKKSLSCKCSVCGLTLCTQSALKVHERQHTGVKPYACDVCGKAFTQKPPLNRHLRSQHGIMPTLVEKCPHCDRMFPSKSVLKIHMVKNH